eukprot:8790546-Alexandrium_andersonii.AAC.1
MAVLALSLGRGSAYDAVQVVSHSHLVPYTDVKFGMVLNTAAVLVLSLVVYESVRFVLTKALGSYASGPGKVLGSG